MAFQILNPLSAPIQTPDYSGISNLFGNVLKGYTMAKEPEKMRAELELIKAQTMHQRMGGALTGVAGASHSLNRVGQMYGFESEEYKRALNAWNLEQQYKEMLTSTGPKRYSTEVTKHAIEENDLNHNRLPDGKILAYDEASNLAQQHRSKREKDVGNTTAHQQVVGAENIKSIIKRINPKDLVQYSGAKGSFQKGLNALSDSTSGLSTDNYKKYQNNLSLAQQLAMTYRYAMKDSTSQTAERNIQALLNPASWAVSPDIAEQKFNTIVDSLNEELENIERRSKGYAPSQKSEGFGNSIKSNSQKNSQGRLISIDAGDGNYFNIPEKDADRFLLEHKKARIISE